MKREIKIIVYKPKLVVKRSIAKLDIKIPTKLKARQAAMVVFGD